MCYAVVTLREPPVELHIATGQPPGSAGARVRGAELGGHVADAERLSAARQLVVGPQQQPQQQQHQHRLDRIAQEPLAVRRQVKGGRGGKWQPVEAVEPTTTPDQ